MAENEVTVVEQNNFLANLPGPDTDMTAWLSAPEAVALVRKTYAQKFTGAEFAMVMALAKQLGANPFTREIHFIKYGDNVSSPLSYHFLNKRMQMHPDYLRHRCNPVYSNEEFSVDDRDGYERVHHVPVIDPKNRGDLLGAYCQVWKRSVSDGPFNYIWIDFAAVNQGNSQWKKAPGWMTRKCALSAGARDAFPDMFAGAYIEEEINGGATVHESAITSQFRAEGVKVATVAEIAAEATKVSDEPKKPRTKATSKAEKPVVVEAEVAKVDPAEFSRKKWDAFVTAKTPDLAPDQRDIWALGLIEHIAQTHPDFSIDTCADVDLEHFYQSLMAQAPTAAPTEEPKADRPALTMDIAKAWAEKTPNVLPMAVGVLVHQSGGDPEDFVKRFTNAYGNKPGFVPSPWS